MLSQAWQRRIEAIAEMKGKTNKIPKALKLARQTPGIIFANKDEKDLVKRFMVRRLGMKRVEDWSAGMLEREIWRRGPNGGMIWRAKGGEVRLQIELVEWELSGGRWLVKGYGGGEVWKRVERMLRRMKEVDKGEIG